MERKTTALVILAAFMVFTCSCIIRQTEKVPPEQAYGQTADVLGVVTTSGEHIEFPKNAPGRVFPLRPQADA
jgi:hypothetical protein